MKKTQVALMLSGLMFMSSVNATVTTPAPKLAAPILKKFQVIAAVGTETPAASIYWGESEWQDGSAGLELTNTEDKTDPNNIKVKDFAAAEQIINIRSNYHMNVKALQPIIMITKDGKGVSPGACTAASKDCRQMKLQWEMVGQPVEDILGIATVGTPAHNAEVNTGKFKPFNEQLLQAHKLHLTSAGTAGTEELDPGQYRATQDVNLIFIERV
ncbi:hypothetical protein [Vibrio nomapromontoriensis]|uniref:hypothetical protein n=1 Tax=Vibrio nomapromontoriensis TaxID=2910246 RepID=UPI003D1060FE